MAGSVMGEISRFAEDKETGGIIMSRPILFVRKCLKCGCVVADPDNLLNPYHSNSWCPKCHSTHMQYRKANFLENILAPLHLMRVCREKKK